MIDYGKLIVDTFVRTVAANEGSRAADQTATTVGVQLQIGQQCSHGHRSFDAALWLSW